MRTIRSNPMKNKNLNKNKHKEYKAASEMRQP